MKVLHINLTYGRGGGGGTEQSIPNLCTLLEARGHDNVVLFSKALSHPSSAPHRKLVHLPGVCEASLRQDKTAINEVLELAEAEQIDLVHFHLVPNPRLVQALSTRFPSVYFVHNHLLTCPHGSRLYKVNWQECTLKKPGLACFANTYLKNCGTRRPGKVLTQFLSCLQNRQEARNFTELLVDSDFVKQTLVASGLPAAAISVIPTVTELPRLTKAELAYPADATMPVILYVGQITEVKGVNFFLEAAAQVRQPCQFVVIGDGYWLPQARKLAAALGIAERVTFEGWVLKDRLGDFYHKSSLLVVPSIYPEPFGLVGTEAMAYARPVIGFRRGGIPEWLIHGKTGFLVEPGNSREMAAYIDEILANPVLGEQMGRAGRTAIESQFDPEILCDHFVNIYGRAIKGFRAKFPVE